MNKSLSGNRKMENALFWLSLIGNIASIFGFLLTITIFISVKNLTSLIVAKATIPQQLNDLEDFRNNIGELLSYKFEGGNKDKIIEYSIVARTHIVNLSPKLKKINKSQYETQIEPIFKNFIKAHDQFISDVNKNNARNMNNKLYEFLNSSRLVMKDDDWRHIQ